MPHRVIKSRFYIENTHTSTITRAVKDDERILTYREDHPFSYFFEYGWILELYLLSTGRLTVKQCIDHKKKRTKTIYIVESSAVYDKKHARAPARH